jgi:ribonuclease-3
VEDRFKGFEEAIGLTFKDKGLLQKAFTHRSYINEHKGSRKEHNERLEFLGDAVLELVVTDYLFFKYQDRTEGELTSYRAALVNTQSIAEGAAQWDMNDYLLLSKGEAKDTGKARQYILADTFEAVIGAIYLDQEYEAAQEFIAKSLFHKTEQMVNQELWKDAKSRFQEKAQEVESITPSYKVLAEEGPDHSKDFTVGVYLDNEHVAEGKGRSKQDAEQQAAEKALEAKGWGK